MRKLIFPILILVLAGTASTEDNLSLSFHQYTTDNLYQMSAAVADQISQIGLTWAKSLKSFSLFVDGDYSYLRNTSNLSDARFGGGADFLASLGEKSALYASLEGRTVLYRTEFNDFNYAALKAAAAFKTYLGPTSIFKFNALSEYRSYRLSQFDFFSQGLVASIDKYFETKTTLKAEMAWGYKYYFHPTLSGLSLEPGADVSWADVSRMSSGSGPGGQGGAPGLGVLGLSSSAGQGLRYGGQGRRGSLFYTGAAAGGGQSLQNASVTGLLAQGIGDRIGIRITGTRQWRLSGLNPFTSVEEYFMIENPTYDAFSWQGYGLSGQITSELPWSLQLKMGYTVSEKEFPGIHNFGLDGSDLGSTRTDRRGQWDVRIEKAFSRISLFLSYTGIKNTSSDPLFGWRGYSLTGGLTWNVSLGMDE